MHYLFVVYRMFVVTSSLNSVVICFLLACHDNIVKLLVHFNDILSGFIFQVNLHVSDKDTMLAMMTKLKNTLDIKFQHVNHECEVRNFLGIPNKGETLVVILAPSPVYRLSKK